MFSIEAALWDCRLFVYAYLLICMSQLSFQVTVVISHSSMSSHCCVTSHPSMSPQLNVSALLPNLPLHPFMIVLTVPQLSVALCVGHHVKWIRRRNFLLIFNWEQAVQCLVIVHTVCTLYTYTWGNFYFLLSLFCWCIKLSRSASFWLQTSPSQRWQALIAYEWCINRMITQDRTWLEPDLFRLRLTAVVSVVNSSQQQSIAEVCIEP